MGSPYFVHQQVNRIHVVKTSIGFERILKIVARSMGANDWTVLTDGPEHSVIRDLFLSENKAATSNSRVLVFLEARYEWRGWEQFQRVIIFDYSGSQRRKDQDSFLRRGMSDTISQEVMSSLFPNGLEES